MRFLSIQNRVIVINDNCNKLLEYSYIELHLLYSNNVIEAVSS